MNFKLLPMTEADLPAFKSDIQEAFQKGFEDVYGKTDDIILEKMKSAEPTYTLSLNSASLKSFDLPQRRHLPLISSARHLSQILIILPHILKFKYIITSWKIICNTILLT
jgi:hypothetical protein